MKLFVRAIVTGFGLSLGSALYKRAAKHFGFDKDDDKKDPATTTQQQDGATDPGLHVRVPS